MKKLKFVGGIFLLAIALVLVILALLFPHNGLFATLWGRGMFTFRGEESMMVIYLTSGVLAILGVYLLVSRVGKKEGV